MPDLIISDSDMEILMVLSDNKGHSNRELAELLLKKPSNLSTQLTELRREFVLADLPDEGTDEEIHFSVDDLKDPISLAAKLVEEKDLGNWVNSAPKFHLS